MLNISSTIIGLFFVAFIAFLAPFIVDITRLRFLPAVVIEIVAGIIIGPQGLHWVRVDDFLRILSEMGLCYLLFLAGLEIELERLRGRLLAVVGVSFLLSFGIALLIGFSLNAIEQKTSPLFVAVILASTSLGIVIPILKDAGESASEFGQLAIAGSTAGEFCSIILLSLFFSDETTSPISRFALLAVFFLLVLLFSLAVFQVRRAPWLVNTVHRLQDTTAQIRVRAALLLLITCVLLASFFGAAIILGAFLAGVALKLGYRNAPEIRPLFRVKLEAIGFGFFVPVFFVTSGLTFGLDALFANTWTLALVPLFLVALLLVRGVPALLYRSHLGNRHTIATGLLQATSLPFIVAATEIGLQLGLITPAISAALVAAGLLSVIIYPLIALLLLRSMPGREKPMLLAEPI